MTLPAKPRGKSAEVYAKAHADAQGELDALRYATDLRHARLADVFSEFERLLVKARGLLAESPGQDRL